MTLSGALRGVRGAVPSDALLLRPLERAMLPRIQVREHGSVDWFTESPVERAVLTLDPHGRERAIVDVLGLEARGVPPEERYSLWVRFPSSDEGAPPDVCSFFIDTLYGYQTEHRY